MTTEERVKQIKGSFRLIMDGATSQSMRQKGMGYGLNWGASVPALRQMAGEAGKDYDLAIALWKENVRECKILATMIMPPDVVLPEVIDIWVEQTTTVEIAEQAAFNLYQHLPYAAEKAYTWLASADDLVQICGYHVLSRLFARRQEPNDRGINEFVDQALAALQSTNPVLRKAAMQSMVHFSDMALVYRRIARSAISTIGLDFI
jgi:hypothetical protein